MVAAPLTGDAIKAFRRLTDRSILPTSIRRNMTPIRKAVFPVAGLGTRFLPATKAMPKEMLPVVDRPLIQHVVDEARQAGIEHFIFVTGRNKGVIEDHFDRQFELEMTLQERQRKADLELLVQELPGPGCTSFTRQQEPLGLGHAVWCARELVGNEPFALLLPDVLVKHERGCLAQMIDAARELDGANIIAVEEQPMERIHMYGVVGVGAPHGKMFKVTEMVEKPPRDIAPSNLIITGRYILQPEIFDILSAHQRGAGNEIQITDAMIKLNKKQPFYGLKFEGDSFDCGSKIGFLAANVAYALARPDIAPALRAELKRLMGRYLIRHPEVAARSAALEGRRPPNISTQRLQCYGMCFHPSRLASLAPQDDAASCGVAGKPTLRRSGFSGSGKTLALFSVPPAEADGAPGRRLGRLRYGLP